MRDDHAARIAAGHVHLLETRASGPVGVLVIVPKPDALLLASVAVLPSAQGTGLGRRLIAHAEALARAGGHPAIRLYANVAMEANIALYARVGLPRDAPRDEDGLDRVFMTKPLGPR